MVCLELTVYTQIESQTKLASGGSKGEGAPGASPLPSDHNFFNSIGFSIKKISIYWEGAPVRGWCCLLDDGLDQPLLADFMIIKRILIKLCFWADEPNCDV